MLSLFIRLRLSFRLHCLSIWFILINSKISLNNKLMGNLVNRGSFLPISLKHGFDECLDFRLETLLYTDLFLLKLFLHSLNAVPLKGRPSMQHLIKEHSETPNVNLLIVALFEDELRSHVLIGPTEALPEMIRLEDLRPSEIAQFDISFGVQQNILWFYIPVHNSLWVKVLNHADYLGEDPQGSFLSHPILGVDVDVEIPSLYKSKDYIDINLVVKSVNKIDQIFVGQFRVNFYFVGDVGLVWLVETLPWYSLQG